MRTYYETNDILREVFKIRRKERPCTETLTLRNSIWRGDLYVKQWKAEGKTYTNWGRLVGISNHLLQGDPDASFFVTINGQKRFFPAESVNSEEIFRHMLTQAGYVKKNGRLDVIRLSETMSDNDVNERRRILKRKDSRLKTLVEVADALFVDRPYEMGFIFRGKSLYLVK